MDYWKTSSRNERKYRSECVVFYDVVLCNIHTVTGSLFFVYDLPRQFQNDFSYLHYPNTTNNNFFFISLLWAWSRKKKYILL